MVTQLQPKASEDDLRRQHLIENILEAEPGTVYIYDLIEQRNVYSNKEWFTAFGYTSEDTMKANLVSRLFHPEDLDRISEHHDRWKSAPRGEVREIEYRARTKAGEWRWLHSREVAFARGKENMVTQILGVAHDITERKRSEQLLAAELRVLEMVSTGASLENILSTLVESVEKLSMDAIGSILLLSPDGLRIRSGAAPHLPETYSRALDNEPIGPSAGSCGTAAWRKETVIVSDIETDPLWKDYRDLARAHGLRACWSTPITNRAGGVLGTFAMYYREVRTPTNEDSRLIERATHLAGIAIEQERTMTILRDSEEQFRKLVEGTHAFLFSTDTRGRITYLNEAAAKALGYNVRDLLGRFYLQFVHPDDRERVHTSFKSQISSAGQDMYAEFRFEGGDGKSGWMSFLVNPIIKNEAVAGLTGVAQDITERIHSGEALRLSEERFSKAFNLSPIRMGILRTHDATILDVNDRFLAEIGFAREEVVGHRLWDFANILEPEDIPRIRDLLDAASPVREIEIHPRTKSGDQRVVLTSAAPIRIGGEQCMLWASQDITERKRAEEQLRLSEARYRAVVENQTEFIVRWRPDGVRTFANEAYRRYFGLSSEQALTSGFMPLVAEEDKYAVEQKVARLLTGAVQSETDTHRVIRADGTIGWQEWFDQAVHDENGNIVEFQSVGRDITVSRQAEEALRHSEDRFRALVEHAPEAIVVLDFETGTFEDVNENACRLFHCSRKELLAKGPIELSPPVQPDGRNSAQSAVEKLQRAIAGDSFRFEWTHLNTLGIEIPCEVYLTRLPSSSRILVRGSIIDITERKRAEEALKRSHEQLRALTARLQTIREEERTRIAREIHDELGQALTGLKMDLSWVTGKISRNQRNVLDRTREMRKLIDSTIGAVRKIASELRPGVLDNLGLVAAVEWQTEEFQKRTDIRCTFNTNCTAAEIDKERSTQLFRILQETLTNVVRHANASQVEVGLHLSENGIALTVNDNGKGITERELMQQKSLGLLGMRERVAMMKGEFTISGSPGQGTKIRIDIPFEIIRN